MKSSIKKIPVVYYHSIGPVLKTWNRNFLTLETRYFEEQLKYFKKNFNVISLHDYYNIRNNLCPSPKNPLVITIDDGFLDNWMFAFPLIKKYELPVTIFISPDMVDPREIKRTLHTALCNDLSDYNGGYMSWPELAEMQNSGLVEIESHTMTHTKYFVSDKIVCFHHNNADCLYPIGNIYPSKKPFHIQDSEFEKLIPYGTPFFEEKSSVIARKVEINPDFISECVLLLNNNTNAQYNFNTYSEKASKLYHDYKDKAKLILNIENDEQLNERIVYEVEESKKIIEARLNKTVNFLCWPHGDNSEKAHDIAKKAGYKATTSGKLENNVNDKDRIGPRFGVKPYLGSSKLGILKLDYKIKELKGSLYAQTIKKIYRMFK